MTLTFGAIPCKFCVDRCLATGIESLNGPDFLIEVEPLVRGIIEDLGFFEVGNVDQEVFGGDVSTVYAHRFPSARGGVSRPGGISVMVSVLSGLSG